MPQPRRAPAPPPPVTQPRGRQPTQRSGGRTAVAAGSAAAVAAGTMSGFTVAGAGILTGLAARRALRQVIGAFAVLSRAREVAAPTYVKEWYRETRPSAIAAEVRDAVALELRREREFRRKQRERIARDLPRALRLRDHAQRQEAVGRIIDRERRFGDMREAAVAARASGTAEALVVEQASPDGAWWELGIRDTHTPDCLAMAGRPWSWKLLRRHEMIPPVHTGCGCRLRTFGEATRYGLTPGWPRVPDDATQERMIRAAKALGHG